MKPWLVLLALLATGLLGAPPASEAAERLIAPDKVRSSPPDSPKLFILAIGVARFDDSFWPTLKWPEQDAKRVAAALGDQTNRHRVVTVLTGKEVTRKAIETSLDEIARQARHKDAVAVYVSTHGTLALDQGQDLEQILVLPATTRQQVASTGLPMSRLRRRLDDIPASRKLLILAACHSGIGKSRLTPAVQEVLSGAKGKVAELDEVSEGVLVLSAAARGETAREDDRLRSDIYTHYFLEALDAFDRNQDGAVSALEAHDYARDRAYAHSGGKQRATLEVQEIGEADLVLAGRVTRRAVPVLNARGEELAGLMIRVDQGVKGRLPTTVALRPSASTVSLYRASDPKPLVSYKVSAPRGSRLELEDMLAGDPWHIGITAGSIRLEQRQSQRLLGDQLSVRGLSLGYRFLPRLSLGLEFNTLDDKRLKLAPPIKASLSWDGLSLTGEYNFSQGRGLDAGAGFMVGRQWAKLTLSDSSQDLSYSAFTGSVGPALFVGWTAKSKFAVRLALRHATGNFDFGEPGSIDSRRTEVMLYGIVRFGGYARRL